MNLFAMLAAVLYAVPPEYPVCNAAVCPERQNDFVWENDKFGMRAYGPGEYHKWSGLRRLQQEHGVERLHPVVPRSGLQPA